MPQKEKLTEFKAGERPGLIVKPCLYQNNGGREPVLGKTVLENTDRGEYFLLCLNGSILEIKITFEGKVGFGYTIKAGSNVIASRYEVKLSARNPDDELQEMQTSCFADKNERTIEMVHQGSELLGSKLSDGEAIAQQLWRVSAVSLKGFNLGENRFGDAPGQTAPGRRRAAPAKLPEVGVWNPGEKVKNFDCLEIQPLEEDPTRRRTLTFMAWVARDVENFDKFAKEVS